MTCPSGFLCKCAAFLNDINRKNAEKSKNKPANFAVLTSLRAGGALLWRTCSRPALLSHSASRRFPLRQCCLGAAVRAASPQTWRAVRRAAAAASLLQAPVDVGCTMLSPGLWAALCRLLLLLTASCRLCEAARHGKTLPI